MSVNSAEARRINGFKSTPSIENAPGVTQVDLPSVGRAVIFSGEAFLNNWFYIFEKGVDFVQRDLGRSEEGARHLMEESMRLDNILKGETTAGILRDSELMKRLATDPDKLRRIPSATFIRYEDTAPGNYFAISVQRMFFPKIRYPDPKNPIVVPTIYHGLRAVDLEQRRYRTPEEEETGDKRPRIGRLLTDLIFMIHRGSSRYVNRNFYAVPVWANMNAKNLLQQGCHPWDRTYDKDPFDYEVVKEIRRLLGAHGSEIESTGVSRGVTEPNTVPEIKSHPMVNKIQKQIEDSPPRGLGLIPENGDSIWGMWKVS